MTSTTNPVMMLLAKGDYVNRFVNGVQLVMPTSCTAW